MNNNWSILILTICLLSGCIPKGPPRGQSIGIAKNCPTDSLPRDLFYKNKPISNECIKELVPILCDGIDSETIDLNAFVVNQQQGNAPKKHDKFNVPADQDQFEWRYIGTLPNGAHLIYSYLWPAYAAGKFTQIAIIKRAGTMLTAAPLITGGDRHATMITKSCQLNGTILTYQQHMTNGLLYETLMNECPELSKHTQNKNTTELYWGEADYLGYGIFEAILTPDGKLLNNTIKSFTLAIDDKEIDQDECSNWKNIIGKNSLSMGDALNHSLLYQACNRKNNTFSTDQLTEIIKLASNYAAYKPNESE